MEVEYTLTPDDITTAFHYHSDHPPRGRRSSSLAVYTSCLLLAVLFSLPALLGGKWSGFPLLFFCSGLLLLFACLLYLFRYRLIARSVKRMLQEGQNAKILGNQRLIITPETLLHASEFSAATTQWATVEKIASTKEHAFFYLSTRILYVLPRRAFANEWEFEEFMETARRYHEEAIRSKVGS